MDSIKKQKQLTDKKSPFAQTDRLRQTNRRTDVIPKHIFLRTLCTLWHSSGNNNDDDYDSDNDNDNNNNNNNSKTDGI